MIATGDISIPFIDGVTLKNLPPEEQRKLWIGNLEGSLLDANDEDRKELLNRRFVFNDYKAINSLLKTVPYEAFIIANNHLLDVCGVEETIGNIDKLGKFHVGAGRNLDEASKPLLFHDNGIDYAIYAFGWNRIRCVDATSNTEGSNPYNKWHVLEVMQKALKEHNDRRVIAFMHWNVELELYPQPLDRELSHQLIDLGVYAVIGCHAHRVQPFEIYKGHPIIYGLGNFAFRQRTYMAGKLMFPEFSYPEIAFEIDGDEFYIHKWLYDPQTHIVEYIGKKQILESDAPYSEMSNKEYKKWFKKNRFQRKAIPVSYYEDSKTIVALKYKYGKIRGGLINLLVKNERLFNVVKSLAARIFR